jgi:non-canonical poly(A) RNA polymerase PAPD5/7
VQDIMPPPAFQFRGQDKENNRNNDRRSRGNHEFTFRFPRSTAERPLLTSKRESTPELLGGSGDGANKSSLKFAHLDEITDSDEAEMDVSDSDSDNRPPRKKRAVDLAPASVPQAPKWSNPDPYTALPPPDETQAKRPDVVKLIRKARFAASAPVVQADAVTTNEDFISFDVGDFGDVETAQPPENAPKGPKNDRHGEFAAGKKRTHDDEIKGFTRKTGKPIGKAQVNGNILHHWRASSTDDGTPWLDLMQSTLHLGTRCVHYDSRFAVVY